MRRKLRKPLAILLAFAMVFCVAPNIGFAADNDANSVERVSGHDRYETAANIAEYAFPNGADAVVIANGEPALGYADALAGSFLAGAAEAPILLTQANVLPDATAEAIETLNATRAYVLGGELAVSDAVYSELEALGLEVERVWGQNRYATAVKVYETGAELVGTVNTALIANATRPSDALAAGAYANEANVPVLLVDQDSIHPATEAALAGIENTFVIGGNLVVSDEVVSELDATRVSGRTRNATSVAVAETLWESPENFVLVNGADGIVDALAGSVLGMPILYVPSDDVDAYLDKVITANSRGLILGGVNRISDEFLNEIQQKIEGVEEELQVVSVSAINATTLSVTFEGQEEAVEVTLDEALTHGQTEVTFTYENVEYTSTLAEAYVDPAVVLAEAVEAAEAAIAEIPEVITLDEAEVIEEARTLVDAAFEIDEDAEIEGLDVLVAAEEALAQLVEDAEALAQLVEAAEVAVVAYEEFEVTNYSDVAVAEDLAEEAIQAVEALAVVGDAEVVEAFEARIAAQEEALAEVVDAKLAAVNNASNQVTLLAALEGFFNNVDADLIADYRAVLGTGNAQDTVAEVQAEINSINVVGDVLAATTQVQLLNALNEGQDLGVFEGVREEYIVTYANGIIEQGLATAQQIQDVIDGAANAVVNAATLAVEAAEAAPTNDALIETAETEVANVPADLVDEDENNIREALEARVADVKVVNDVLAAERVSSVRLLNSLKANGFENIVDDSIDDYKTAIGALVGAVTVQDIQDEIDAENLAVANILVPAIDENSTDEEIAAAQAAIDVLVDGDDKEALQTQLDQTVEGSELQRAINAVAGLTVADPTDITDEEKADAIAALKALSAVADDFDYGTVTEAFLGQIVDAIETEAGGDGIADAAEVQTLVEEAIVGVVAGLTVADPTDITDEEKADAIAALKALSAVADDFDYGTVTEAFLGQIVDAIETEAGGDGIADAAEVQTLVEEAIVGVVAGLTVADPTDITNEEKADAIAALKALSAVADDFDYATVIESLLGQIVDAIETEAGGDGIADAAEVQTIVTGVPLATAAALTGADEDEDILAAFTALAQSSNDFNINTVNEDLLNEYAVQIAADGANTATLIQASVTEVNNLAEVNAVETAAQMRTALNKVAVFEIGGDADAYLDLSSAAKLEVAAVVLADRADETDGEFANTAAVVAAVKAETDDRAALFTADTTSINTVQSISGVRTALVTYGLESFTDLGSAVQLEVAEYLLNNRPAVVVEDNSAPTVDYVSGGYTTIAQIEAAIEAALAE
jgi:putative cell wall-binding protein